MFYCVHPVMTTAGGKGTFFEGGVRTAAFVTGGLLPPAVRGTTLADAVHVCDWHTTFLSLAGMAAAPAPDLPDHSSSVVPGVDGVDVWPRLSGQTQSPPRTEVPTLLLKLSGYGTNTSKLIVGIRT